MRSASASLGAEEPPPGGLAALVVFELHALGHARLHVVLAKRRRLARDAGEELGAVHELVERRGERRRRVAPREKLAARVAHGVTRGETALHVVARGRRHAADAE